MASAYFVKTEPFEQTSVPTSEIAKENAPKKNKIKKETSKIKLEKLDQAIDENEEIVNKKQKWEPPNWKDQLDRIKEMRSDASAPVDTMGCDALTSVDQKLAPNVNPCFLN